VFLCLFSKYSLPPRDQFLTNWITISHTGEKLWLEYIEFFIVTNGGSIRSVRAEPFYRSMTPDQINGEIKAGRVSLDVRYSFEDWSDSDYSFGLAMLFITGFGVTVALVLLAFSSSQSVPLPSAGQQQKFDIVGEGRASSANIERDLRRFNHGGSAAASKAD
jgi:hypothetical protein